MSDLIARLDAAQRRQRLIAFAVAVLRKAGDDQAGLLAIAVTCYAFLAVFPLLLILVTVLGIVLRDDPSAQQTVLHSALTEFPIIGTQLRENVHSLNRTGVGLVIGLVGTAWGARGLANSAQQVCTTVWAVPFTARPQWISRQLRSLGILATVALAMMTTGTVSSVAGVGSGHAPWLELLGAVGSTGLNSGFFILGFRLSTPPEIPTHCFVRGACVSAVTWQLLLALGGYLVAHELRNAEDLYGLFGIVLGLLAWLHLQARFTILVLEADCVRARRLWPRTLDGPRLVPADVRAYREAALAQRRRDSILISARYQDPDSDLRPEDGPAHGGHGGPEDGPGSGPEPGPDPGADPAAPPGPAAGGPQDPGASGGAASDPPRKTRLAPARPDNRARSAGTARPNKPSRAE
jgi:uncharacterized BrkB/YihY/UPF0761 family membrane protein